MTPILALILAVLIMVAILAFFWLLVRLYAYEEPEGNIINGERCILMNIGDDCTHKNPKSRIL